MNTDGDDQNYGENCFTETCLVSVCCGARKLGDSDVCSICGEPTSFEMEIEQY